jgi:mRNA-degrading endonuclease toxin of MazEF toxin-antitoxin module
MVRGQVSKAMADQLTTASQLRFKAYIGRISDNDMYLLENAMLFQLGIDAKGGRP